MWLKNGKIISPPSVAWLTDFDRQGKKIKEWQVFRDTTGAVYDTSYVDLDDKEREIHGHSTGEDTYTFYNNRGEVIKTIYIKGKDTIINENIQVYTNDTLVKSKQLVNGSDINSYYEYSYKDGFKIGKMYQGEKLYVITEEKRNKANKLLVWSNTLTNTTPYSKEKREYQYNTDGTDLSYRQFVDNQLIKTTQYEYKKGLQVLRTEYYYNPTYVVKTTYSYEYW
jgi:hypothetical protein